MKKIIPLCLCAVLMLTLASCRGVAQQDLKNINFIPDIATIQEQTPGHIFMEAEGATLEQVIQYYELAILYAGARELARDDTQEGFWSYTGIYEERSTHENRRLRITLRDMGEKITILVTYLDEMRVTESSDVS